MSISVVIPTFNRRDDLVTCLDTILSQTYKPSEIIIVNNGLLDISDIIDQKRDQFSSINISLLYFDNQQDNSITVAKNIGVRASSGSIISFLDDDMTIDPRYFEEIMHVFSEFPDAKGVTGYNNACNAETNRHDVLKGKYDLVTSYVDTDTMIIRPSLTVSYPDIHLDHVITCQWLSGASCFKRDVLKEIKPDGNLKKYSWNEDQDLSFRIYKKYPGSLFLTPFAKYWHSGSPTGRSPKKEIIFMGAVYDRYLFQKNFNQTFTNRMIFMRGTIFKLIYYVFFTNPRGWLSSSKICELIHRLNAIGYCFLHKKEITGGDLSFFNETLK